MNVGKTLVFLTNNTVLPALTICALYKSRWQVELFFEIKQHLRIKRLLGTSENAVKTQIWCAIATYVLIAIVKKECHLDASLYNLSTDPIGLDLRENRDFMRLADRSIPIRATRPRQPIDSVRLLTGHY